LYRELRAEAIKMLLGDLIHGDLSPFNVLLGWNGPTIIDFPQIISAPHNNRAEWFFKRDLENLRRFFAGIDSTVHAYSGDGHEIWRAYLRRELTPDFVPSGRKEQRAVGQRPRVTRQPSLGAPARRSQSAGRQAGGGGDRGSRGTRSAQPEVSYRGQLQAQQHPSSTPPRHHQDKAAAPEGAQPPRGRRRRRGRRSR
jgi:RIO kinase 1